MSRALATTTANASQPVPAGLDPARLPVHVAVIMDGNGRWAKQRNLPRVMGHREGVEALKRTLRLCSDWGIGALTAYAFSTENWNRPGEEVSFLMALFERVLARELQALEQEQVRIRFLGDLEPLPEGLQRLIADATERTAANTGIHFNVCTNYGGGLPSDWPSAAWLGNWILPQSMSSSLPPSCTPLVSAIRIC